MPPLIVPLADLLARGDTIVGALRRPRALTLTFPEAREECERLVAELARTPHLSTVATLDVSRCGYRHFETWDRWPEGPIRDHADVAPAAEWIIKRVGDAALTALAASPHLPALTSLVMRAAGLARVPQLASRAFENLRRLELGDNGMFDFGIEDIVRAASLGRLEHLGVSHNPLRSEATSLIGRSTYLAGLRSLDLSNCLLGAWDIEKLLRDAVFTLERLDLHGNTFDDDAAVVLASAPRLSELTWLDVRDCHRLTDVGKARLVERFGKRVKLSATRVRATMKRRRR